MKNVANVVEDGLCTGCGTCAGICPAGAILMDVSEGLLLPKIDLEKCTSCGLCLECCISPNVDFGDLNSKVFGKLPEDPLLGNYLACYVGHSTDREVRYNSSSGGLVTQLLLFALEKGIIDGALVTRMGKNKPLEPEPFIARTSEEVISASKSKYCPAAVNEVVKQILKEDGKFAVVGLPCHLWGIRAAETVFEKLKDKIVLHIGLFCGHTVNFMGTDLLLKKFRLNPRDIVELDYRGNGWPGSMSIRRKDGKNLTFKFNRGWYAYWNVFSPFFFAPIRCMMCHDQFSEFSDISVGDAWLPELRGKNAGESILITRTAIAENLLKQAERNGDLSLNVISAEKVKESQGFSLNFKKKNISMRLSLFRRLGKKTPVISPKPGSSGLLGLVEAFCSYLSFYVSSRKRLRSFLVYDPLPLFRLYFGIFKCAFLLSKQRG